MSDTSESAVRRIRQESPTVDAVCRQLHHELGEGEGDLAVRFAELFLSKAPPEFLHERSADALSHLCLGDFRFLGRSRREQVDVEVVNPEVADEGWYAPVTVIRTNVSERPFIIDTIRECLHSYDLAIEYIVYPLLAVERDAEGNLVSVGSSREGEARESLVHCEVGRITDGAAREALRQELARRLEDVRRATDDFGAMTEAVNEVVTELAVTARTRTERTDEVEEIQAFLRWLRDGGFVFLGYRGYDIAEVQGKGLHISVVEDSGLGVLRDEDRSTYAEPQPMAGLTEDQREIVERGPLLIISKTNAESTVHRRARMDYIGIKKLAADGSTAGEHRFLGLFTSKAYAEDAENIPILRRKLKGILEESGVQEGSHDYKEIITIFNSLPKEEVFLASAEEVGRDVRTILTSYHTAGVRVAVRRDPLGRGASVMVILPKDRFSGEVRKALGKALVAELDGAILNYHLALGAGDQARLHFYMALSPERLESLEEEHLEQLVSRIIRSWTDRVREGLERVRLADEARRLAQRYGDLFGAKYQAAADPESAVADILELEAMEAEGRTISVRFGEGAPGSASAAGDEVTELKLLLRGERLILSDFMPILENGGLRVVAVTPFEVGTAAAPVATLYSFAVQDSVGRPLDISACGTLLAETILAVRRGDALDDSLNRLVVAAGLHWREVDVLRAYAGYAFQVGAVPSRQALPMALGRYPGIARELFDLFQTLFDPSTGHDREARLDIAKDIRLAFQASLRGVSLLADDRVLRRLEALISGTLRTNYYRRGGRTPTHRSGGAPYVSFKFGCRNIDFLRSTGLLYEVWVHSSRMEGVHLRGGRVARGGIRWSDRPDDFRKEILGLVRTQMVKNSVIVPAGSKGGFVPRIQPDGPEERFAEGRDQYRTLIRGLLDLTDNLDGAGEAVPPEGVVCHDDPDPYLVVAADKGTATFSDVANSISEEYGFWLGDAFASGGSNGYDHKAVGITARGAWECVRRHFREHGKDIQAEPFTVVGIGDMSGDVFGNGMLLSRQIRLLAAFDHRHIFIDPNPDPASTYAERERMFALGRSSWEDYDQALLSPGGMIVPRGSKEVELSQEAREALGVAEEAPAVMDGETLIRAVLGAPVELLWNGGIGTYVKSPSETHADAGDPSNDAVRIDVPELRCKVVGEGGNLGMTQRARIEFGMRGGCVNTDALDNSGGVDMSDHEVNLKILFADPVRAGHMTADARNELLEALTEEVAELVLEDNRSQSLAVSLDELRTAESTDAFRDLMVSLERAGELDRASEALPTTDVLAERKERGESLARPELCVLLSYAKVSLKKQLLGGVLPSDELADRYLLGYFPKRAIEAAGPEALQAHRLRREIVAGQLTNDLVDLMGATFVNRLIRETGRSPEDVARSWLVASRLAGQRELLDEMAEQQSAMETRVAYRWLRGLARVLERTTRWVLSNVDPGAATGEFVRDNVGGLAVLRGAFHEIVAGEDRNVFETLVGDVTEVGAAEAFSRNLVTLRFLDHLLEVLEIARASQSDELATGRAFYEVSDRFDVPWLHQVAFGAAAGGPWEQRAAQALSDDLARVHRKLVMGLIGRAGGGDVPAAASDLWTEHQKTVDRFRGIIDELRSETAPGLAAASVAIRELAKLADRAG